MTHPVNAAAPDPVAHPEQATAQAFARRYAASAVYNTGRLHQDPDPGSPAWTQVLTAVVANYTAAHLFRALIQHAPEHADQVARELASGLEDGGHVHEMPWEWLDEYGIDPEVLHTAGDQAAHVARADA
ncbi:hypothetical protein [Streptomonospora arabica]|uniref:Uncharacterized protein n=1 Tax=Streptomonospora arabica TaxID=412417 RepID=A0ABV9SSG7_9ACTN